MLKRTVGKRKLLIIALAVLVQLPVALIAGTTGVVGGVLSHLPVCHGPSQATPAVVGLRLAHCDGVDTHEGTTGVLAPALGLVTAAVAISELTDDNCGHVLWHYTSKANAEAIYASRSLTVSAARDGFPPGAYTTDINPLYTGMSKAELSNHLGVLDVSYWVAFCRKHNPDFQFFGTAYPNALPTYSDFWYIPSAFVGSSVSAIPSAYGVNPM